MAGENELAWREQVPGVLKMKLGSPPELNPLSVIGAKPKLAALEWMSAAGLPFSLVV